MPKLKVVGNPVQLPDRVDRNKRMTNYIRSTMKVLDLIPVRLKLDHTRIDSPQTRDEEPRLVVKYEFEEEMDYYKKDCESYGLEGVEGIRCYTTDESSIIDNFNNVFTSNNLQSIIDNISQSFRLLRFFSTIRPIAKTAVGYLNLGNRVAEEATKALIPEDMLEEDVTAVLKSLFRSFTGIVVEGKTVSLPKIWEYSSYEPSMQLVIKLISPYGSPKSIKKYVVEPLIYLLILSSPLTTDGISYGWPRMVRVRCYGSFDIYAAYITNVSLRRGGDDSVYNIYRQPLQVTVSLSLEPIIPGFAAFTTAGGRLHNPDAKIDELDQFEDDTAGRLIEITAPTGLSTIGNVIKSFKPFKSRTVETILQEANQVQTNISMSTSPIDPRNNISPGFLDNFQNIIRST